MKNKSNKSAKGIKGFLLYSPFDKNYFFRIYDENDKSKFKDYDLAVEELEVEILSSYVAFDNDKGKLNYTRRVYG